MARRDGVPLVVGLESGADISSEEYRRRQEEEIQREQEMSETESDRLQSRQQTHLSSECGKGRGRAPAARVPAAMEDVSYSQQLLARAREGASSPPRLAAVAPNDLSVRWSECRHRRSYSCYSIPEAEEREDNTELAAIEAALDNLGDQVRPLGFPLEPKSPKLLKSPKSPKAPKSPASRRQESGGAHAASSSSSGVDGGSLPTAAV